MNVLITGNLSVVTNELCEKIIQDNDLVVSGSTKKRYDLKKITTYDYNVGEKEFDGIMKVFNFDKVIYFSNVLEGVKNTHNELENLENVLYSCVEFNVKDFIYVNTNDYVRTDSKGVGARNILLNTCEELCKDISIKNKIDITMLRVPYICSRSGQYTQLGKWIKNICNEEYVEITGWKNEFTDFVCDEDLGVLISRIIDEQERGFITLEVYGNNKTSFLGLSEIFKAYFPETEIKFKNFNEAVPKCIKENKLRKMYGWFSKNKLQDIIYECIEKEMKVKKVKEVKAKKRERTIIKKSLIVVAEMVVLFAIAQLLSVYTKDVSNLNCVDFRLLFVVIFGITYGVYAGIGAAILACVGYIISDKSNINLQILFYDVSNWIPFAVYFIAGSLSGYVTDKKEDYINSLNKRVSDIEEKYIFLNELYTKALDNKEKFNKQIIGYNDSYGKVYEIIQKLNNAKPEKVFNESVRILESALNNKYIAMYSVDTDKDVARVEFCSGRVKKKIEKNIKLKDYPVMYDKLINNKNFVNNRGLKGYPAYANPIFRNGRLEGIVIIEKAYMSMMNKEFINKFNILTSFIKETLIRIFDTLEKKENSYYASKIKMSDNDNYENILFIKDKKDDFINKKNIYELFSNINMRTSENVG